MLVFLSIGIIISATSTRHVEEEDEDGTYTSNQGSTGVGIGFITFGLFSMSLLIFMSIVITIILFSQEFSKP